MKLSRAGIRLFVFLAAFSVLTPIVVLASYESGASGGGGKWTSGRIQIALSKSLESSPNIRGDAREAVDRSIALWTAAASVQLDSKASDLLSVSRKGIRGDGVSLITTALTPENLKLFPLEADSPAAITRIFADGRGRIVEADIVLNPFVGFSTDGAFDTYDLQETLTHEIGHLLGLDHSPVFASIMYDRLSKNTGPHDLAVLRRSLPAVDRASIKALYGPKSDDFACCASVSGTIAAFPRGAKAQLWIEESGTGRIIAAGLAKDDATFRVEGIPDGDHVMRVFVTDANGKVASGEAKLSVTAFDSKRANLKISNLADGILPKLFGNAFQLGRSAVRITPATSAVTIGGDQSLSRVARVGISGTDVWITPSDPFNFADAQSVKVIQLNMPFPSDLTAGEYSLVIEDNNGVRSYVPGSLIVYP